MIKKWMFMLVLASATAACTHMGHKDSDDMMMKDDNMESMHHDKMDGMNGKEMKKDGMMKDEMMKDGM